MIFLGGPVIVLPNYFLKSVKIFSLTHTIIDEGVICSLMFDFSQRKRTDNMKLTQNKAQSLHCRKKMGSDPHPHTHTHTQKRNTIKGRKRYILEVGDPYLPVAIFPRWAELLLSSTLCLAW